MAEILWLTSAVINHSSNDAGGADLFTRNMVNRGAKPNKRVEQALHHSPVVGMVDKVLLSEIRHAGNGQGDHVAAAHRTALEMSWQLHLLMLRRANRI